MTSRTNLNKEPAPGIKNSREMNEMFLSYGIIFGNDWCVANRYKDRDNMIRVQIDTHKSVADVFDDF